MKINDESTTAYVAVGAGVLAIVSLGLSLKAIRDSSDAEKQAKKNSEELKKQSSKFSNLEILAENIKVILDELKKPQPQEKTDQEKQN
jgi:prefoldin subunit 5